MSPAADVGESPPVGVEGLGVDVPPLAGAPDVRCVLQGKHDNDDEVTMRNEL